MYTKVQAPWKQELRLLPSPLKILKTRIHVSISVLDTCVWIPPQARRGCQVLWSWSYELLWTTHIWSQVPWKSTRHSACLVTSPGPEFFIHAKQVACPYQEGRYSQTPPPPPPPHVASLQLQMTRGQESASVLKTRLNISSLLANWEGERGPEQVVAVQSRVRSHKQAERLWRRQCDNGQGLSWRQLNEK